MSLNIIFMGTPDFAVPALQKLLDSDHSITCVYSQPPRPSGRGHKVTKSPIQQLAETHNIPVHHPVTLRHADAQNIFTGHKADIIIVAAYGLILPPYVLEHAQHGCVNIHPSLLPRWRGAAPIQRTIMAGDNETGIAIMQMDEGLDTGDIITLEKSLVPDTITAGELHDKLASEGADQLLATLTIIENGTATRTKQSEDGVTYAHKIDKKESWIDWHNNAHQIHCKIRGLSPFPGAGFLLGEDKIKILTTDFIEVNHTHPEGLILEDMRIACADGFIIPTRVQKTGKNAMSVRDFLNGNTIPQGTILL